MLNEDKIAATKNIFLDLYPYLVPSELNSYFYSLDESNASALQGSSLFYS
jgi:hypothetical protein